MKVRILECSIPLLYGLGRKNKENHNLEATTKYENISFSPDEQYAVVTLCHNEVFIAVAVLENDSDVMTCRYIDHFIVFDEIPMLRKYYVDWGFADYGFCKLIQWAPELANNFNGSFSSTLHRFYFDRALYEQKYEELNGVPYKKRKEPTPA